MNNTIEDFLRFPVNCDLRFIPGMTLSTLDQLQKIGVTNSFQLVGKIMMLKKGDSNSLITCGDHISEVSKWLDANDIEHDPELINAILEKCAQHFPGFYDCE